MQDLLNCITMSAGIRMCHIHGRRSVGDGGDAPPTLFLVGGQHRNCPPHFSVQKNCGECSLTHHSSLKIRYIGLVARQ